MTSRLWRVSLAAPDAAAAAEAAVALDTASGSVSAFEGVDGTWLVEGLSIARPDTALIETLLALAWSDRGGAPPVPVVERVASRDWLAENRASFPRRAVGRYVIHGSHDLHRVPAGATGLEIDAATAFGTGEHATTQGCLMALGALARHGRRRAVLDMGSGTGILAIAAAKTWHVAVAACDSDEEAVRVTRRNARVNGVAALVAARRGACYDDRSIVRAGPFDLVFANILARPLITLARGLAAVLAPDGVAVLSGLLARQEPAVLAAHRRVGLVLLRRIPIGGWHTLMLARRPRAILSMKSR